MECAIVLPRTSQKHHCWHHLKTRATGTWEDNHNSFFFSSSGWYLLGPRLFHKIQGRTLCFGGVLWEQSLQCENSLSGEQSAVCPGDRTQRKWGGCNPTTSLSLARSRKEILSLGGAKSLPIYPSEHRTGLKGRYNDTLLDPFMNTLLCYSAHQASSPQGHRMSPVILNLSEKPVQKAAATFCLVESCSQPMLHSLLPPPQVHCRHFWSQASFTYPQDSVLKVSVCSTVAFGAKLRSHSQHRCADGRPSPGKSARCWA